MSSPQRSQKEERAFRTKQEMRAVRNKTFCDRGSSTNNNGGDEQKISKSDSKKHYVRRTDQARGIKSCASQDDSERVAENQIDYFRHNELTRHVNGIEENDASNTPDDNSIPCDIQTCDESEMTGEVVLISARTWAQQKHSRVLNSQRKGTPNATSLKRSSQLKHQTGVAQRKGRSPGQSRTALHGKIPTRCGAMWNERLYGRGPDDSEEAQQGQRHLANDYYGKNARELEEEGRLKQAMTTKKYANAATQDVSTNSHIVTLKKSIPAIFLEKHEIRFGQSSQKRVRFAVPGLSQERNFTDDADAMAGLEPPRVAVRRSQGHTYNTLDKEISEATIMAPNDHEDGCLTKGDRGRQSSIALTPNAQPLPKDYQLDIPPRVSHGVSIWSVLRKERDDPSLNRTNPNTDIIDSEGRIWRRRLGRSGNVSWQHMNVPLDPSDLVEENPSTTVSGGNPKLPASRLRADTQAKSSNKGKISWKKIAPDTSYQKIPAEPAVLNEPSPTQRSSITQHVAISPSNNQDHGNTRVKYPRSCKKERLPVQYS